MTAEILGTYRNGNYVVMLFSDGTKLRTSRADELIPTHPESIDIKICNRCDMNCPMCHEDSKPEGEIASLKNLAFLDTLKPYTELAIGGGNPLEHPGLVYFLRELKEKHLIPNMTVHQQHFLENYAFLKSLTEQKLVYGLGVSVTHVTDELIEKMQSIPNLVVHVINGVIEPRELEKLCGKNLNLLILGYKNFRRGRENFALHSGSIERKMESMSDNLPSIIRQFRAVSFDNLAIKQLAVKKLLPPGQWDEFYMGNEGQFTMYIDLVKRKYAQSSTSTIRYTLEDDIVPMFARIH